MAFPLQNKHALWLAAGLVAAVATYIWLNWEPAVPVPAGARAPNVGGVSSTPGGPQTPEYARLRQMADTARAERARETGGSSVPTPPELQPLAETAPRPPVPPPGGPPAAAAPASQTPPAGPQPDETERMTSEFARAMQDQTRQLVEFRKRFEPAATRMVSVEDIKGQRERAEAQKRAEELLKEARAPRPRDRHGFLKPGNILFAVLQTAINSDEPGPVRAKVVGERFKGAILLGGLSAFPPVVGSRPERVLVKFDYLTTPDQETYRIDAYAIDTETARTALASDVDHHYVQRYGSLFSASFLEGFGEAIRNNNRVTSVGVFGNVVSVPKNDLNHGEIAREALGTVGQRLGGAVAENFRRPNTITVDPGTGLGILINSPTARAEADEDAGAEERRDEAATRGRTERAAPVAALSSNRPAGAETPDPAGGFPAPPAAAGTRQHPPPRLARPPLNAPHPVAPPPVFDSTAE